VTGRRPACPAKASDAGKRLWVSIVDDYELAEHELVLLRQAVRTLDLVALLEASIRRDGPVIESPQGRKAHPAVVEIRQQRVVLARLLSALRLPAGEEGDQQASARPQRRVGVRGMYSIDGGAS
jgi:hypothetical protein